MQAVTGQRTADIVQRTWHFARDHRAQAMSGIALTYALVETASLAVVHHTGPELYGVVTAAVAASAGAANIVLLRSSRVRRALTGAVVLVWIVVALGGIAGTIAHAIGLVPGDGFVDPRPRPAGAPLAFTLVGTVGAAALILGQRARARLGPQSEKE